MRNLETRPPPTNQTTNRGGRAWEWTQATPSAGAGTPYLNLHDNQAEEHALKVRKLFPGWGAINFCQWK